MNKIYKNGDIRFWDVKEKIWRCLMKRLTHASLEEEAEEEEKEEEKEEEEEEEEEEEKEEEGKYMQEISSQYIFRNDEKIMIILL